MRDPNRIKNSGSQGAYESERSTVRTTHESQSSELCKAAAAAFRPSVISLPGQAGIEQTSDSTRRKGNLVADVDGAAPTPRERDPEADESPFVVEPMKSTKRERLSSHVESVTAVVRMEKYLKAKTLGLTELATRIGTTDRTLRTFRATGKLGRDLFRKLAEEMETTPEELMRP